MIPASTAIVPAADAAAPSSGTPTSATAVHTPTFDDVLTLQNVAGTIDGVELTLEETELAGVDDDDLAEDLEDSLAFLADLLAVTRGGNTNQDFSGESGGESFLGAAKQGAQEALLLAAAGVAGEGEDAGLLGGGNDAAIGEAAEPQGLARAAEILATAAKATDADKSTLTTHVRDPRWADELGARVTTMIRARESTASLQLTPVDLGPVEVNVTVRDSLATIHFGATQADTRALLEASLPRLREMLAAQGFELSDASVSSGFARSQQRDGTPGGLASAEAETSTTEARPVRLLGLVDLYA